MSSEPSPENGASIAKKPLVWIDALADRLASTGLSWARQGLSMSKRVLETSAKTLSQTAGSLDAWEKKLERPEPGTPGDVAAPPV